MNVCPIGFNSHKPQNKYSNPAFGMDVIQVEKELAPIMDSQLQLLRVHINKTKLGRFIMAKTLFQKRLGALSQLEDRLVVKAEKVTSDSGTNLVLTLGEKGSKTFYPLAVFEDFTNNLAENLLYIAAKLDNTNETTLKRLRAQAQGLIKANN